MPNPKAVQGERLIKPYINNKHQEKVGFALVGEDSNFASTVVDIFSRVR
jgi:hypothetical protein